MITDHGSLGKLAAGIKLLFPATQKDIQEVEQHPTNWFLARNLQWQDA